jgi:multicomponent K+:H+ antiporter subunit D
VAAFSPEAMTAALYYLVHSTFAAACLFLIADLVVSRRGADTLRTMPPTAQNGLYAALFFGAAIAMAGMPPLSGFLGKLLVLDAIREPGTMPWAWTAILVGSLFTIVGFARAGSTIFWKSTAVEGAGEAVQADTAAVARPAELAPVMTALAVLALIAAFAGPLAGYLEDTSNQLFDRQGYVSAVLSSGGDV